MRSVTRGGRCRGPTVAGTVRLVTTGWARAGAGQAVLAAAGQRRAGRLGAAVQAPAWADEATQTATAMLVSRHDQRLAGKAHALNVGRRARASQCARR